MNEIYKPQFVKVTHSKNKSLKGTLIKFDKRLLYVQTATTTEVIDLDKLDKLSYRSNEIDHTSLRPFVTAGTSIIGFLAARVYNNQRPTIYNENGLARKDLDAYRQIFGVVLGLIFSSEVSDAISTLLTPTETLFLSEAEYEKQKLLKTNGDFMANNTKAPGQQENSAPSVDPQKQYLMDQFGNLMEQVGDGLVVLFKKS